MLKNKDVFSVKNASASLRQDVFKTSKDVAGSTASASVMDVSLSSASDVAKQDVVKVVASHKRAYKDASTVRIPNPAGIPDGVTEATVSNYEKEWRLYVRFASQFCIQPGPGKGHPVGHVHYLAILAA